MKKLIAPLAAAALTAAAFAAISVANDDGSKQGNGDAVRPGPGGGPPGVMFRAQLSEEDQQALEEFRSCMEEQGAPAPPEPPQPGEGEDGTFEQRVDPPSKEERAQIDEALKACEDKLPEGARHMGPPCGPPPGADGEGTATPGPPPGAGSQQEGTAAPAPQGASS